MRRFEGFGYRIIPHWKDLLVSGGVLLIIGILVIPIGLGTGFLQIANKWPRALDGKKEMERWRELSSSPVYCHHSSFITINLS